MAEGTEPTPYIEEIIEIIRQTKMTDDAEKRFEAINEVLQYIQLLVRGGEEVAFMGCIAMGLDDKRIALGGGAHVETRESTPDIYMALARLTGMKSFVGNVRKGQMMQTMSEVLDKGQSI
jgi:hypothetical protein